MQSRIVGSTRPLCPSVLAPQVKKRILEFLAVRQLTPASKDSSSSSSSSTILCLVGAPGVGKTSLGK
jgi:ATP-dependent Lon protease